MSVSLRHHSSRTVSKIFIVFIGELSASVLRKCFTKIGLAIEKLWGLKCSTIGCFKFLIISRHWLLFILFQLFFLTLSRWYNELSATTRLYLWRVPEVQLSVFKWLSMERQVKRVGAQRCATKKQKKVDAVNDRMLCRLVEFDVMQTLLKHS